MGHRGGSALEFVLGPGEAVSASCKERKPERSAFTEAPTQEGIPLNEERKADQKTRPQKKDGSQEKSSPVTERDARFHLLKKGE